jgi:hypothetical protein
MLLEYTKLIIENDRLREANEDLSYEHDPLIEFGGGPLGSSVKWLSEIRAMHDRFYIPLMEALHITPMPLMRQLNLVPRRRRERSTEAPKHQATPRVLDL